MQTSTNQIPRHIPSTATERAAVRLEPWRREILEYLAAENRTTLSDIILKSLDLYFIRKGKIRRSEITKLAKNKYEELELWNWNIKTEESIK
jgi:hypothetical protein